MHRFYLPPDECNRTALTLVEREAHHALHVLRLKKKEEVIVLDGSGGEYVCEVRNCEREKVHLTLIRRNTVPPLPYKITLLQAVPKGKIIEAIIQKATELGVSRIVPLLTERVTTRLDNDSVGVKGEKWQQVATEAIKQCGSTWLPKVESPISLNDFLQRKEPFDLSLVASLQPGSRHARTHFDAYREKHQRSPESVSICVGPEGDFTPSEVAEIETSGALPITLGRLILRSETAATYCLSILNHELSARS